MQKVVVTSGSCGKDQDLSETMCSMLRLQKYLPQKMVVEDDKELGGMRKLRNLQP